MWNEKSEHAEFVEDIRNFNFLNKTIMAKEIERKFLVDQNSWNKAGRSTCHYPGVFID